jgi:hypothetical protein
MSDNTISELVFKSLSALPENTKCYDCGKALPLSLTILLKSLLLTRTDKPILGVRKQRHFYLHELCCYPQRTRH